MLEMGRGSCVCWWPMFLIVSMKVNINLNWDKEEIYSNMYKIHFSVKKKHLWGFEICPLKDN